MTFDLESGVRVMCDVGYLCANFSLPRLLCSRVRPDVHDRQTDRHTDVRQTDVRQKHHLMYFTNVLVMHPWPYCNGHNRNDVMMIVMIVICDYDYDTNFTVDRIWTQVSRASPLLRKHSSAWLCGDNPLAMIRLPRRSLSSQKSFGKSDNLTRTTKRQSTYKCKLTQHKIGP